MFNGLTHLFAVIVGRNILKFFLNNSELIDCFLCVLLLVCLSVENVKVGWSVEVLNPSQ